MPLAVADLQGDISTAAKKLAAALDQLKSVRRATVQHALRSLLLWLGQKPPAKA